MKRHASLSFADLSRLTLDYLQPRVLTNPSMYVVLGLPFGLLLPVVPVRTLLSSFCSLRIGPRNLSCFCLICFIISLEEFILSSIISFDILSIHDILNNLLQNHISAACILFTSVFLRVHDSHPYNRVDHTQHLTNRFLVSIETLLFVNKFFILLNAHLALFILFLISSSHLPSSFIKLPR